MISVDLNSTDFKEKTRTVGNVSLNRNNQTSRRMLCQMKLY